MALNKFSGPNKPNHIQNLMSELPEPYPKLYFEKAQSSILPIHYGDILTKRTALPAAALKHGGRGAVLLKNNRPDPGRTGVVVVPGPGVYTLP